MSVEEVKKMPLTEVVERLKAHFQEQCSGSVTEKQKDLPGEGKHGQGYTVLEAARLFRVSPDKVRNWINSGKLLAINRADAMCGKPKWVILPDRLNEFAKSRTSVPPPEKRAKRRKQEGIVDYYPD